MIRTTITAMVFATASTAAFAAPLTVQEAFEVFNGITSGDFQSNQEVEGRLYVGGDLTGNSIQIGFQDVTPSPFDEGIVVGNATINTLNMQNGSDLTVGGNGNGTLQLNAGNQGDRTARFGGSFTGNSNQGTTLDNQAVADPNFADRFPDISFAQFIDEAEYLNSLAGTAIDTSDQNNKKIIGDPDSDGLSVHTATLADLQGGGYTIDANGASTILINVSGEVGNFQMNPLGGSFANAELVVWNFFEATSVNIGSAVIGSILAPLADLSGFNGSTEGSVIAKSIDLSNGELHSRTFTGTLPTNEFSAVPLPAGLPLVAGALGSLMLLRRKRLAA